MKLTVCWNLCRWSPFIIPHHKFFRRNVISISNGLSWGVLRRLTLSRDPWYSGKRKEIRILLTSIGWQLSEAPSTPLDVSLCRMVLLLRILWSWVQWKCLIFKELWPLHCFPLYHALSKSYSHYHIIDAVLQWKQKWSHHQRLHKFFKDLIRIKHHALMDLPLLFINLPGNHLGLK